MRSPLLLAALLPWATAVLAADAPRWRVDALVSDAGEVLEAKACSDDARGVVRFRAGLRDARRFRREAWRSSGAVLDDDGDDLVARDWQPGECLHTRIALAEAARAGQARQGAAAATTIVADPRRWLWRPRAMHADSSIGFTLPPQWSASLPWTPLRDNSDRYRFGPAEPDWSAQTAFGRFDSRSLDLPGGTLRIALLPPWGAAEQQRLEPVARALLQAFGRLPRRDAQVLVRPLAGQRDAMPWGEVTRGGGSAVHLFAGADAAADAIALDWTATHEFAHLLHPHLGSRGRWLGEGLASYYQNVLRARSGALDPTTAWERIEAGFGRGRADARSRGLTLANASRQLHSRGSFMRVYWSGAAYWLEADLALRARGGSLDDVLRDYAACCLAEVVSIAPDAYVAALDRLAGFDAFATRYRRFAALDRFPATPALAPTAPVFRAIMQRRPIDAR